MAPSVRFVPRSLTHPGGLIFLDPAHRVSREELDRRDARWRALRDRAAVRVWSDDATLVGSMQQYAASALRDFEERTLGRSASNVTRRLFSDESNSSIRNGGGRSFQEGGSIRRSGTDTNNGRFTSMLLTGSKRNRRFRATVRKWVRTRIC
ncbi:hypothetical protein CBS101457_002432 [Exobasidium rhododendri]|nr:hypothetical protein CBS101457_002432 [Exobasidium rhododendri]